ncbi:MAG: hypothetical protein OXC80_06455 [Gammaproteobacteria bacterium]|nr:hypothetical protein [Gammaproteobacteria bacterium]
MDEAIWYTVKNTPVDRVRLVAGGGIESWDVGPSKLREMAYRLAGHGVEVEVLVPEGILSKLQNVDLQLIASLADHPKISITATQASLQSAQGWLIAETISTPSKRWAFPDNSALAFGPTWSETESPLISTEQGSPSTDLGRKLESIELWPVEIQQGDQETMVQHNLDGTLQGFGKRLWEMIALEYSAVGKLLEDADDNLVSLRYSDRYLFSPLCVALLTQLVRGLRAIFGLKRLAFKTFEVVTAFPGTQRNKYQRKIWHNWHDTKVRDAILKETLKHIDIDARVTEGTSSEVDHSRILEMGFESGKILTVRFDQGISYWRSESRRQSDQTDFDFRSNDVDALSFRLANLNMDVVGQQTPTYLFVKMH